MADAETETAPVPLPRDYWDAEIELAMGGPVGFVAGRLGRYDRSYDPEERVWLATSIRRRLPDLLWDRHVLGVALAGAGADGAAERAALLDTLIARASEL